MESILAWSRMMLAALPVPLNFLSKVLSFLQFMCFSQFFLNLPLKMANLPSCYLLLEPATFVKRLADCQVETGNPIVLEATYSGTPPISVSWMKNEYPLSQSHNCSITMTEKSTILEILDSTIEDYAQYSCLIENEAGQDICEALVSVLGVLTVISFFCSLFFLFNILF